MDLSKKTNVLAFHAFPSDPPSADMFRDFHSLVSEVFREYGIQGTYFGAQGAGYSEDYTKIDGRAYKRMVASNFEGIVGLSLLANPASSDAPAYDSFALASLGYIDVTHELLLCMVVNEAFVLIRSRAFDHLVDRLVRLGLWDFGYAYTDDSINSPELYVMAMDNGRLAKAEQNLLKAWYAAPPELRQARMRDIYPYNFVNNRQLEQEVEPATRLKTLITNDPASTFAPTACEGLYSWKIVDDRQVDVLRQRLRPTQVVISK